MRYFGLVVLAGSTVVAPWLFWNLDRFGTIEQSSTWARPAVLWELFLTSRSGAPRSALLPEGIARALTFLGDGLYETLGLSRLLLVAMGVGLGVAAAIAGRWSSTRRSLGWLAASLLVAGVLLAGFHAGVRWFPRVYYFEWLRMALSMGAAVLVAAILGSGGRGVRSSRPPDQQANIRLGRVAPTGRTLQVLRTTTCSILGVVLVWNVGASVLTLTRPGAEWQPSMVAAAERLDDLMTDGERALSFNAGYIGYLTDHPVTNVDGVVNNSAAEALRNRELAEYMCDTGATWLVDFHPVMMTQVEPFLGSRADDLELESVEVVRAPGAVPWGNSEMQILKMSCTRSDTDG